MLLRICISAQSGVGNRYMHLVGTQVRLTQAEGVAVPVVKST